DVPVHPAGAKRRTTQPDSQRIFSGDLRHTLQAIDEDTVAGEQVLVFVNFLGKDVEELSYFFEEAERRIERQTPDVEVRGHHALAADHLINAQQVFTFAEAIEEDRHGADVHGVRAQPDQMRADALEFGQHHAHPLRAWRDLQSQQLLHGHDVAQVVDHGA